MILYKFYEWLRFSPKTKHPLPQVFHQFFWDPECPAEPPLDDLIRTFDETYGAPVM